MLIIIYNTKKTNSLNINKILGSKTEIINNNKITIVKLCKETENTLLKPVKIDTLTITSIWGINSNSN